MKAFSFIACLTLIGLSSCTTSTDTCIAISDPECANITTYSQGACN